MERLVQLIKGEEPKFIAVDDEEEDIQADLEGQNAIEAAPEKKEEDSDDEDMIIEEI